MLLLAIGCIYSLSGWLANRLLARIEEDPVQELIYRQSSQQLFVLFILSCALLVLHLP
ncbi:hypothetical protein Grass_37 [Bacillus phage Grass]|uniref:Uncharacterized protein n=1 Tax=Bacillus phage Grass TaxID=1406785 RepID=U5PXI4_BPGRA|nr:hypothetical protein Grass_37 [Bacillus phage Grass]AGY47302.1 hypothetical protein Grass_37 [Bacillus phage Grass]